MSPVLKTIFVFLLGAGIGGIFGYRFQERADIVPTSPTSCESPTSTDSSAPSSKDLSKEQCMEALGLYQIPLLDPPVYHENTPAEITTNYEGEARLRWKSVPRAKSYYVVVETQNGEESRTFKTPYVALYLKGLPKVETERELYFVKIASINSNDMIGPFSEKRKLWIKKPLNLNAPQIKEIRIED